METAASGGGWLSMMFAWIAANPGWAGLAVFLISLGESLVLVGLFLPGTLIMFSIGSLVAVGAMDLGATIFWAILGAIVGDGISYRIGRHYHESLRQMWPFNHHPEWMERAELFFHRHGGKSVVFGRFAGPVRPIIPAVAGMLGMPPWRFFVVNVVSAVLWAPAYILPGVVLGASLTLAAGVATRLALLAVLVIGLLWLTGWLVQRLYGFLQPRANRMGAWALEHGNRYDLTRSITRGVLDPAHPEVRAVLELGLLLLLAATVFFTVLAWQLYNSGPAGMDNRLYYLLQNLRTPWADAAMVLVAGMSSIPATLAVLAAGIGWLAWRQNWPAIWHWLALIGFGMIAASLMNLILPASPPVLYLEIDGDSRLLTHAQISLTTLVYGFMAILIAREAPAWRRALPYVWSSLWIVLVVLANLYLSRYWLSDALQTLALALAWVALLGLAYARHVFNPINVYGFSLTVFAGFSLACTGYLSVGYANDVEQYAFRRPQFTLQAQAWWLRDWQQISARRIDWGGQLGQPMTMQWAGDLERLRLAMEGSGWKQPVKIDSKSVMHWFNPQPRLADLPVLPKVHDGQHEALRLVYPLPDQADDNGDPQQRQLVLRLWPADTLLADRDMPVWVGNITREILHKSLGMITLPSAENDFDQPLQTLLQAHLPLERRLMLRPPEQANAPPAWRGGVLLMRQAP